MKDEQKLKLSLVNGVEGRSVYLNDYRIAGPKPWGGGNVIKEWEVEIKDINRALANVRKAGEERK